MSATELEERRDENTKIRPREEQARSEGGAQEEREKNEGGEEERRSLLGGAFPFSHEQRSSWVGPSYPISR